MEQIRQVREPVYDYEGPGQEAYGSTFETLY